MCTTSVYDKCKKTKHAVVSFVFNCLRRKVVVPFVDIGRIGDQYSLILLKVALNTINKQTNKQTNPN
jgi:hypothetical protein